MNPMIIMNIDVEENNYDINVSPDKRDVFIKNEDEVVEHLKTKVNEFFDNIQRTKAYDNGTVSGNGRHSQFNKFQSFGPAKKVSPIS
jgi:DNA mismatch repair ATPase MutL